VKRDRSAFFKNSPDTGRGAKTFSPLRAVLARSGPTRREADQKFFASFFQKRSSFFSRRF